MNRFGRTTAIAPILRSATPPGNCAAWGARAVVLVAAMVLQGLAIGCGGGGGTRAINPPPPSDLVYPHTSISATVGTAIATDTPTVTGTVSSYTISPALPAGLAISSSTGAISGTPTTASAKTSYTVTASNSSGSTTAAVSITVTAAANTTAPSNLVYPQSSISAIVGTAIATDTPTVTGTVASYTISPALPAGLAISSSTGAISGTPTAASVKTSYTVTASNSTGSTTATVSITVTAAANTAAPSNLVYPRTSISATVGTAIATDTPTVKGTVTSYTISPALPAGLAISSSTGAISGTPTAASAKTSYTVTASNSIGSATATVSITVAAANNTTAPSDLVYPQSSISAIVGTAITTDTPTVKGTVTSYAISPALPSGLVFNSSTGAISGTPTAASAKTSYTVTAANSSGQTTAAVSITVVIPAPSNLVYPQTSISAIVGTAIATDTPTVKGTVTSYAISPALPAGLAISSSTGSISGTPTAASAKTSYTVTASNSSGSTRAAVSIAVVLTAPSNLVYPQTSIAAIVGTAIATDTPTVSGIVTLWDLADTLVPFPAGLTLSRTTGAISGTPTAVSASTTYTINAINSAGSTTATVSIVVLIPAPSNLVYPQTSILGDIGVAIATDTPSVTGTVTSYTVSPALPAGLAINATTGAISGTPTAVSAQANYTVTASNSTGSTTAVLSIGTVLAAPSNLEYAQPSIVSNVGGSVSDAPTVAGPVTSYTIQPALPAGLSIDPTTGVISGTPTAASAQASYTVTASNSAGSTTAAVSITVLGAPSSFLDLGFSFPVGSIRETANSVLALGFDGRWILWDYASGQVLASGYGGGPIDMAGSLAVIQTSSTVGVYSADTGQQIFTVPGATWFELATDASYVCTGSASGLTVWSPSGSQEFTIAGNYSTAVAFAAPGRVQIASGPAGASVIETDLVPSGNSSISATFTGIFGGWFTDGHSFVTTVANDFFEVYNNAAVEQSDMSLPTVTSAGGVGSWLWGVSPSELSIYTVGNGTPVATYTLNTGDSIAATGSTLAIVRSGTPSVTVIDLSGASPSATPYTLPSQESSLSAFGAYSSTQWAVGNTLGVLLDGATVSTTPRYFDYGAATAIAGSPSNMAIATASGQILLYNSTGTTQQGTIDFFSGKVELSSDGSVLAASAYSAFTPYATDLTLNIYSLPSQAILQTYPYTFNYSSVPYLVDFNLSASGQTLGQVLYSSGFTYSRQVTGVSGSPLIWSESGATSGTRPLEFPRMEPVSLPMRTSRPAKRPPTCGRSVFGPTDGVSP